MSNSSINDDDKILKEQMKDVHSWENINEKVYSDAKQAGNTPKLDSLDQVDFEVLKEKRRIVSGFVKEHPQSVYSAMAIAENYGYYAEADEVKPLYETLSPEVQQSAAGVDLDKLIKLYETVAVGKTAPEISQPTVDGPLLNLSSLRGKIVLVDFWASWCPPCRRENPRIVDTYSKFKDKGFAIYAVSYDTKKEKWLKAISDDHLGWNQVSDLAGWKNSTSDQYGIKAIPANLLLDKEGKIVAKNLFGKQLSEKLAELTR